jgi:hypothetical protein
VIEHLLSKCKPLGSIPSITKRKKTKQNKKKKTESSLALQPCGDPDKTSSINQEALIRHQIYECFDPNFPVSRTVNNKFVVYKPTKVKVVMVGGTGTKPRSLGLLRGTRQRQTHEKILKIPHRTDKRTLKMFSLKRNCFEQSR